MLDNEDILELGPLEKTVRIAGEEFVLREMAGAALQRYTQLVTRVAHSINEAIRGLVRPQNAEETLKRARQALRADAKVSDEDRLAQLLAAIHPSDVTVAGLEDAMAKAVEIAEQGNNALFEMMLGRDADWCSLHLTSSMRHKLLELQNQLNGMDELAKNVRPLLASNS